VASLSIIGLPPLGGAWSKWTLALGALDAGYAIVMGVLMLSSLLSVAYLLPVVAHGFFLPPPGAPADDKTVVEEAPLACLIALSGTALLCFVLFVLAGPIETLLGKI
jgi:multicomponent Na+:H+ antiporter subunit D